MRLVGLFDISRHRHATEVLRICTLIGSRDVLDYGCGQRTLERSLGFEIRNYDPNIPGLEVRPKKADIVVCTDVLEHIEPDRLDKVLDDLRRVTGKIGYFVIATGPGQAIQERLPWWLPKLEARFSVIELMEGAAEFSVKVRPYSWRDRIALVLSSLLSRIVGSGDRPTI